MSTKSGRYTSSSITSSVGLNGLIVAVVLISLVGVTSFILSVWSVSTHSSSSYFLTGQVIAYVGKTLPQKGWLLCDGSAVNKDTYFNLYTVIGDTYGEDSVTFTLPNFSGKFLFGAENLSDVGVEGGSQNVTIEIHNMPSHNHNVLLGGSGNIPVGTGNTLGSITGTNLIYNSVSGVNALQLDEETITSSGGNQPLNVLNPYSSVAYIIKT